MQVCEVDIALLLSTGTDDNYFASIMELSRHTDSISKLSIL